MHRIGEKRQLASDSPPPEPSSYIETPPRKRLRGRPSSGVQSPVSGRLYGWYQKVSHWLMNVFSDSRKESIPTPSSASLGASSTGSPSSPHSEALPAGRSTSTALIAKSAIYMPPGDKTLIRCLNQDRPFGKGFQCNESAGCNVRLQSNSMDRPVGKGFHRNGCSEWIQSGEVSEQAISNYSSHSAPDRWATPNTSKLHPTVNPLTTPTGPVDVETTNDLPDKGLHSKTGHTLPAHDACPVLPLHRSSRLAQQPPGRKPHPPVDSYLSVATTPSNGSSSKLRLSSKPHLSTPQASLTLTSFNCRQHSLALHHSSPLTSSTHLYKDARDGPRPPNHSLLGLSSPGLSPLPRPLNNIGTSDRSPATSTSATPIALSQRKITSSPAQSPPTVGVATTTVSMESTMRKKELESISCWIKELESDHKRGNSEREVLLSVANTKLALCQRQRQAAEEHLVGRLRDQLQETHLQELSHPPWDLEDSELDEVGVALTVRDGGQCLVERYRIRICRNDLSTLEPTAWLNDEVMNFYFSLIQEYCNQTGKVKVHIFNSFFFLKLTQSGFSGVRRWTKKVDVFSCDLILLPVHLGMHWCLAVVNLKKKQLLYFDSLLGNNHACLHRLREYLKAESLDKKKELLELSDWTELLPKDIPQQQNCWDCGVFTCMYARYTALGAEFSFSQKDMPAIRNMMVLEILQQKLKL